jgi:hypothetical protein
VCCHHCPLLGPDFQWKLRTLFLAKIRLDVVQNHLHAPPHSSPQKPPTRRRTQRVHATITFCSWNAGALPPESSVKEYWKGVSFSCPVFLSPVRYESRRSLTHPPVFMGWGHRFCCMNSRAIASPQLHAPHPQTPWGIATTGVGSEQAVNATRKSLSQAWSKLTQNTRKWILF